MQPITVTPEFIVTISGAILSLCFSYIPKFNTWYAALDGEVKRAIMLGLMLVVTGGVFVLACTAVLPVENFACEQNTAVQFVYLFVLALISNQATHRITPRTKAVLDITKHF